jgi:hypothetical protein
MILDSKYPDKELCYKYQLESHPSLTSQTRVGNSNLQKKISNLQQQHGATLLVHVMYVGDENG